MSEETKKGAPANLEPVAPGPEPETEPGPEPMPKDPGDLSAGIEAPLDGSGRENWFDQERREEREDRKSHPGFSRQLWRLEHHSHSGNGRAVILSIVAILIAGVAAIWIAPSSASKAAKQVVATAEKNAKSALEMADTAEKNAQSAITTANTAKAAADNANKFAGEAKANADTAVSAANGAATVSGQAKSDAGKALETAKTASGTADTAASVADKAMAEVTKATTAAVNAGKVAAEAKATANAAKGAIDAANQTAAKAHATAEEAKTLAKTANAKADSLAADIMAAKARVEEIAHRRAIPFRRIGPKAKAPEKVAGVTPVPVVEVKQLAPPATPIAQADDEDVSLPEETPATANDAV